MPKVVVQKEIASNPDKIWEIISDMEKYPKFMKDLVEVKVIERSENYTKTHWVGRVKNMTVEWDEEDFYFPEDFRIEYKAEQGIFSKFEGEWKIEPMDNNSSRVTLTVDFEIGVPMFKVMLGPLATKIIKDNCEMMLSGIKNRAEM